MNRFFIGVVSLLLFNLLSCKNVKWTAVLVEHPEFEGNWRTIMRGDECASYSLHVNQSSQGRYIITGVGYEDYEGKVQIKGQFLKIGDSNELEILQMPIERTDTVEINCIGSSTFYGYTHIMNLHGEEYYKIEGGQ